MIFSAGLIGMGELTVVFVQHSELLAEIEFVNAARVPEDVYFIEQLSEVGVLVSQLEDHLAVLDLALQRVLKEILNLGLQARKPFQELLGPAFLLEQLKLSPTAHLVLHAKLFVVLQQPLILLF